MRGLIIVLLYGLLAADFIMGTNGILKKILGSAILGDIIPALYSIKCIPVRSNFTEFMLYTRIHPDDPRPLVPNNWNLLKKSEFDPTLPTKLIIHGFIDNMRLSDWMIKMKNALLREGDYNIIVVDWSCGNGFPYTQAVKNSKRVGEAVTDLVSFLKDARGANPSDFHLIGHSLGSQISAVVGHKIPNLGRISGLDPAGPKFYNTPQEEKLDPSDANFVDVIHTDAGSSMFQGLGLHQQLGHIDFYPNGGKTQPGCHSSPLTVLPIIGFQRAARYYLTCDHYRAIDYYIESIGARKLRNDESDCQYIGVKCRDWTNFAAGQCGSCYEDPNKCTLMGYYSDRSFHRNPTGGAIELFLKTSEAEPFCVHQYQVIFETGPGGGGFSAAQLRSDTTFDSDHDQRIEKIYLEVKTGYGKVAKLILDDKQNEILVPKKRHTFLATSKFPLGDIEEANIWWGSEDKPDHDANNDSMIHDFGFTLKSVDIVPITLQSNERSRSMKLKRSSLHLCGNESKLIAKGHFTSLSIGKC